MMLTRLGLFVFNRSKGYYVPCQTLSMLERYIDSMAEPIS